MMAGQKNISGSCSKSLAILQNLPENFFFFNSSKLQRLLSNISQNSSRPKSEKGGREAGTKISRPIEKKILLRPEVANYIKRRRFCCQVALWRKNFVGTWQSWNRQSREVFLLILHSTFSSSSSTCKTFQVRNFPDSSSSWVNQSGLSWERGLTFDLLSKKAAEAAKTA